VTAPPTAAPVRLFYIDDSGAEATGWIIYSWIEVTIGNWSTGLRRWLDLRKDLYARYRIPPAYELHATAFAGGRGNPSTNPTWNRALANRIPVMHEALATLAATPHLRVGTAYRRTHARGSAYHTEREHLYH